MKPLKNGKEEQKTNSMSHLAALPFLFPALGLLAQLLR